jgi:hypothetical protein
LQALLNLLTLPGLFGDTGDPAIKPSLSRLLSPGGQGKPG